MLTIFILLKILIIAVIAGLLYRAGGTAQWEWCKLNQKWWRWLVGVPIGFLFSLGVTSWLWVLINMILCGVTYYIATAAFIYGGKSWLNFLGEKGKFIVCGLAFGAASIPLLGWWGLLQMVISGGVFFIIKILDDKDIIKNPYVEFFRGFLGAIMV